MLGMSIVIIWDYLNSLNSVDLWCFEMLTTLINEMFIPIRIVSSGRDGRVKAHTH